jgi:hypothetical protein
VIHYEGHGVQVWHGDCLDLDAIGLRAETIRWHGLRTISQHECADDLMALVARVRELEAKAEAAEAEAHDVGHDYDRRGERLWRLAVKAGWRPGNPAENDATAEMWIADALARKVAR